MDENNGVGNWFDPINQAVQGVGGWFNTVATNVKNWWEGDTELDPNLQNAEGLPAATPEPIAPPPEPDYNFPPVYDQTQWTPEPEQPAIPAYAQTQLDPWQTAPPPEPVQQSNEWDNQPAPVETPAYAQTQLDPWQTAPPPEPVQQSNEWDNQPAPVETPAYAQTQLDPWQASAIGESGKSVLDLAPSTILPEFATDYLRDKAEYVSDNWMSDEGRYAQVARTLINPDKTFAQKGIALMEPLSELQRGVERIAGGAMNSAKLAGNDDYLTVNNNFRQKDMLAGRRTEGVDYGESNLINAQVLGEYAKQQGYVSPYFEKAGVFDKPLVNGNDPGVWASYQSQQIAYSGVSAMQAATTRIIAGESPEVATQGVEKPDRYTLKAEQELYAKRVAEHIEATGRIALWDSQKNGDDATTQAAKVEQAKRQAAERVSATGRINGENNIIAELVGGVVLDPLNVIPLHEIGAVKKIMEEAKGQRTAKALVETLGNTDAGQTLTKAYQIGMPEWYVKLTDTLERGAEKNAGTITGKLQDIFSHAAEIGADLIGYRPKSEAAIKADKGFDIVSNLLNHAEDPEHLRVLLNQFVGDADELAAKYGNVYNSAWAEVGRDAVKEALPELNKILDAMTKDAAQGGMINAAKFYRDAADAIAKGAEAVTPGIAKAESKIQAVQNAVETVNGFVKGVMSDLYLKTTGYAIRNAIGDTGIALWDGLGTSANFDQVKKFVQSVGGPTLRMWEATTDKASKATQFAEAGGTAGKTGGNILQRANNWIGDKFSGWENERYAKAWYAGYTQWWEKGFDPKIDANLRAVLGEDTAKRLEALVKEKGTNPKGIAQVIHEYQQSNNFSSKVPLSEMIGDYIQHLPAGIQNDLREVVDAAKIGPATLESALKGIDVIADKIQAGNAKTVANVAEAVHPSQNHRINVAIDAITQHIEESKAFKNAPPELVKQVADDTKATLAREKALMSERLKAGMSIHTAEVEGSVKAKALAALHDKDEEARFIYAEGRDKLLRKLNDDLAAIGTGDSDAMKAAYDNYRVARNGLADLMNGAISKAYMDIEEIVKTKAFDKLPDYNDFTLRSIEQMTKELSAKGLEDWKRASLQGNTQVLIARNDLYARVSEAVEKYPELFPRMMEHMGQATADVRTAFTQAVGKNAIALELKRAGQMTLEEYDKAVGKNWDNAFVFARERYSGLTKAQVRADELLAGNIPDALKKLGYPEEQIKHLVDGVKDGTTHLSLIDIIENGRRWGEEAKTVAPELRNVELNAQQILRESGGDYDAVNRVLMGYQMKLPSSDPKVVAALNELKRTKGLVEIGGMESEVNATVTRELLDMLGLDHNGLVSDKTATSTELLARARSIDSAAVDAVLAAKVDKDGKIVKAASVDDAVKRMDEAKKILSEYKPEMAKRYEALNWQRFETQYRNAFSNVSAQEQDAALALIKANAAHLGMSKDDYVAKFVAGVEKGGGVGKGGLFDIRAWHGTPHEVDKFSLDKIGTGEGQQVFGWGLYFAENKQIAEWYQEQLKRSIVLYNGKVVDETQPIMLRLIANKLEDKYATGDVLVNAKNAIRKQIAQYQEQIVKDEKKLANPRSFSYNSLELKNRIEAVKENLNYLKNIDPKSFSKNVSKNLYEVNLRPNLDDLLQWDVKISEQPQKIKTILEGVIKDINSATGKNIGDIRASSVYNLLAERNIDMRGFGAGSPEAASKYLLNKGVSGIAYFDGASRSAGEGTRNFVIFDDKLVDILSKNGDPNLVKASALFQRVDKNAKGAIEFIDDGRAVIRALNSPDVSTMAHESAHLFRRTLQPDELAAANKWAGVADGKAWDVKQEERFARAFEDYLSKGNAPTPELKNVFEQFKDWLAEIYKEFKGMITGKSDAEIEKLFAQILTPAEMNKAQGVNAKAVAEAVTKPDPEILKRTQAIQRKAVDIREQDAALEAVNKELDIALSKVNRTAEDNARIDLIRNARDAMRNKRATLEADIQAANDEIAALRKAAQEPMAQAVAKPDPLAAFVGKTQGEVIKELAAKTGKAHEMVLPIETSAKEFIQMNGRTANKFAADTPNLIDMTTISERKQLEAIQKLREALPNYWERAQGPVPTNLQNSFTAAKDSLIKQWSDANALGKADASARANFAALDYSLKRGFDPFVQFVAPFSYWSTRQGRNFAFRMAERPQVLAHWIDYQEAMDDYNKERGTRARMEGGFKVGEYKGSNIYWNPMRTLAPWGSLYDIATDDPIRQKTQMQENYDMLSAIGLRPGPHIDIPMRLAEWLIESDDPNEREKQRAQYGIEGMAEAYPVGSLIKGATAALGIGGSAGVDIEGIGRYYAGLAPRFQETYDIGRAITDMSFENERKAGFDKADYILAQSILDRVKQDSTAYREALTGDKQAVAAKYSKEMGATQGQVEVALTIFRDATNMSAKSRGFMRAASILGGMSTQIERKGEELRNHEQEWEKSKGYDPLTGYGSRAARDAVQKANPASAVLQAQYATYPGEKRDPLTSWIWEMKDRVTAAFDTNKDSYMQKNPADRRGAAAIEKQKWDALNSIGPQTKNENDPLWKKILDDAKGQSPEALAKLNPLDPTYSPKSIYGANPQEALEIRKAEIVKGVMAFAPKAEAYLTKDGAIDYNAYKAAQASWEKNIVENIKANPLTAKVLLQAEQDGDAMHKGLNKWLDTFTSKEIDTYRQRYDSPMEAMQRAYFDQVYGKAMDKYAATKNWNGAVGDVGAMNGDALIELVKKQYPNRWTDAELKQALGGVTMPSMKDIVKMNVKPEDKPLAEAKDRFFATIDQRIPPGKAGAEITKDPLISGLRSAEAKGLATKEMYDQATLKLIGWANANYIKPNAEEWAAYKQMTEGHKQMMTSKYGADYQSTLDMYFGASAADRVKLLQKYPALNQMVKDSSLKGNPLYDKYNNATGTSSTGAKTSGAATGGGGGGSSATAFWDAYYKIDTASRGGLKNNETIAKLLNPATRAKMTAADYAQAIKDLNAYTKGGGAATAKTDAANKTAFWETYNALSAKDKYNLKQANPALNKIIDPTTRSTATGADFAKALGILKGEKPPQASGGGSSKPSYTPKPASTYAPKTQTPYTPKPQAPYTPRTQGNYATPTKAAAMGNDKGAFWDAYFAIPSADRYKLSKASPEIARIADPAQRANATSADYAAALKALQQPIPTTPSEPSGRNYTPTPNKPAYTPKTYTPSSGGGGGANLWGFYRGQEKAAMSSAKKGGKSGGGGGGGRRSFVSRYSRDPRGYGQGRYGKKPFRR